MKALRTAYPSLTVLALAGLAATWVAARHSFGGPDTSSPIDLPPGLSAANDPVIHRVAMKQEVATALLRGEINLSGAVARFRDVNGDNPARYALLREQYPRAGDEELCFRQVLHFVRWHDRSPSSLVATRLPQLEAEFFARFPGSDPFPGWFRNVSL